MTKLAPVAKAVQQLLAGAAQSARLKVAHILPDPNQPRKTFDQEKYDETKASIKAIGLQVPITVNPGPVRDGVQYYYVKFGENRWRIHVDLEQEYIECVINPEFYDGRVNVLRVITQAAENINRIEHTHSEMAAVYALYYEEEVRNFPSKKDGKIQEGFATIFGKSLVWAGNYAAMSNLRPEFLARVDGKGPTQIPFMAAVALGKNPKERQTGVLHSAEVLAGARRDMLYRYVLEGTHKIKKAHGERIGGRTIGVKQALMRIPNNMQNALDYFGAGMQPLDRQSYLRETLEQMSQEELRGTLTSFDKVQEGIETLKGAIQARLDPPSTSVFGPILTASAKGGGKEAQEEEEVPTGPRKPWPGFPSSQVQPPSPGGDGTGVRRVKGDRY